MVLGAHRQYGCDKQPNQQIGDDSCGHIETRLPDESLQGKRFAAGQAVRPPYNFMRRSRSAFAITETELKLIAAPAIIGLRRMPNSG